MIGKIEKARRYADEPKRAQFLEFQVKFQGDNSEHMVSYRGGHWECGCRFFQGRGVCSHTMALERILGEMLPAKEAVTAEGTA
jgi:hypothetical protein